ncbi:Kanadaptin [Parelaphostrongylus tenuis]|uniref:Kanadaptin n=1 Tax=Parelaphostrongylus tenuis TaxID=148309 RepID=A0AAD5RAX2_PARTN|nr:Kanadaptin [Parelaphostrongylus tenuis]
MILYVIVHLYDTASGMESRKKKRRLIFQMTETPSLDTFKAPTLPHHQESSESHDSLATHLNSHAIEMLAEAIMPDDSPSSPIERAEAEAKISIAHPTLHYSAPPWASIPEPGQGYKFEVVKNGVVVDMIDFGFTEARYIRSYRSFTPTVTWCCYGSEAVSVQLLVRLKLRVLYGEDTMDRTGKGWHIYDLGSTHGSKANKKKLPAKQYVRIRVGFVLQFGGSTRLLSLLGPSHDCEAEWNCSPSEMMEKLHKKALDAKTECIGTKGNGVRRNE